MKNLKKFVIISVSLILSVSLFAQAVTDSKTVPNGTILEEGEKDGHKYIVRKHEQTMWIGYSAEDYNKIVYEDFLAEKEIGNLKQGDKISISQYITVDEKNILLKISTADLSGYIFFSKSGYDVYEDGNWTYQETLNSGDKIYHTLKNHQYFLVYENLRIRDVPGLNGNKIGLIEATHGNPASVQTLAVTEEKDFIDGKTERWAKIEYKGITGWVFGGYLEIEAGGPKFHEPKVEIDLSLGDGI